MIKKIFGLILIIGIIYIIYYLKKNPIPVNCACGTAPWWGVCTVDTTLNSKNCIFYVNTVAQINTVYSDIKSTFKTIGTTLNKMKIPKIPDMPINLKTYVNNSFSIPKISTNFTLIPSISMSCPIPNPLLMVKERTDAIISDLKKIGSGLESLADILNGIDISDIASLVAQKIKEIAEAAGKAITAAAEAAGKAISDTAVAAGEEAKKVGEAVKNLTNNAGEFFKGIGGAVAGAFSSGPNNREKAQRKQYELVLGKTTRDRDYKNAFKDRLKILAARAKTTENVNDEYKHELITHDAFEATIMTGWLKYGLVRIPYVIDTTWYNNIQNSWIVNFLKQQEGRDKSYSWVHDNKYYVMNGFDVDIDGTKTLKSGYIIDLDGWAIDNTTNTSNTTTTDGTLNGTDNTWPLDRQSIWANGNILNRIHHQRDSKNSNNIYYRYRYIPDTNMSDLRYYNYYDKSGWVDNHEGNLHHLGDNKIECPANEMLAWMQFQHGRYHGRYNYACRSRPTNICRDMATPNFPMALALDLNQHNIMCDKDEGIKSIKLDVNMYNSTSSYKYKCCKP